MDLTQGRGTRDRRQLRQSAGYRVTKIGELQSYETIMPRNDTIPRQAGKRPIKPLSAQEKVNAIKRVHEGESKASVARDIGVPESTLRGWCKAQHKLFNQAKNQSSNFEGSIQPIDSTSEDDGSSPRSTSRSPPTNGNALTGVTNLAMREASNDDAEMMPPAKRAKLTDNCTTPVVNNSMSNLMVNTSSQGLPYNGDLTATLHYQRLVNAINSNPDAARLLQQNSIYNAFSMNLLNAQNGLQYTPRNNGVVSNLSMVNNPVVAGNAIVANNVVLNGANNENKRKHNSVARQVLSSNRKHANTSSVDGTERSATPMASGITNGGSTAVESSVSRPRQETRTYEELMQQIHVQQLQHQHNTLSDFITTAYQRLCASILMKNEENGILERKKRLEEALQQNKNTYDENENKNRPNGVPEGIDTALNQAQSLEKWLTEYGSPYFTSENVKMLQIIISKLQGWMEGSKSEGRSTNSDTTS